MKFASREASAQPEDSADSELTPNVLSRATDVHAVHDDEHRLARRGRVTKGPAAAVAKHIDVGWHHNVFDLVVARGEVDGAAVG